MKRMILLLMLWASVAAAQTLEKSVSLVPYLAIEQYHWEEFENDGQHLVKEVGPRYAVGLVAHLPITSTSPLFGEIHLRYSLGKVAYDGALIDGLEHTLSYSTRTFYSALSANATLGYSLNLPWTFKLTPLTIAGAEYWIRNLDYHGPYGHTERFLVFSVGGGIRLTYAPNRNFELFAATYLDLPLTVTESFTVASPDHDPFDVVLHPGTMLRFKTEAGASFYRVFVVISFERWTLTESDVQHLYYQPRSVRQQVEMRLGYTVGF